MDFKKILLIVNPKAGITQHRYNIFDIINREKPAGTVIAQSILSGTSVKNGTKITLVVSKGKQ